MSQAHATDSLRACEPGTCVATAAQAFLRQLAQSLEAAMQQHQEPGAGRKQIVHAVQLVRAIPFYGFHPDEQLFIKIVLYNPGQVTRIATLLQVMLKHMQLEPAVPIMQNASSLCYTNAQAISGQPTWCPAQSGAVMNRIFQPHESHVPFLLQFKASHAFWLRSDAF